MAPSYEDAARALSSPTEARSPYRDYDDPIPMGDRRSTSSDNYRDRIMSTADKVQRTTISSYRRASDTYRAMTVTQRVLVALAAAVSILVLSLFVRFGESIFAWIAPLADSWRQVRFGWMILWALTFIVSFPPLIGYSSCVTIAGFIYGVRDGWFIVATATILGSTASFLASRYFLSSFVHRLVSGDRRFNALALTLKHDGLKLLVMIRLCPLPYSISNGAIATFPTVNWSTFMLASAIASPKLLIHVFIGSRLAAIAGDLDKMDTRDKNINEIAVGLSGIFGAATAFIIYRQTKKRAAELEALERDGSNGRGEGVGLAHPDEFDDLDEARQDDAPARRDTPQIRIDRFHD